MTDEQTESEPTEPTVQLPVAPGREREAAAMEIARLNERVQSLTLEQWEVPSAAEGWSVGDVVVHLNLVVGLYIRVLDAVVAGKGTGTAWKAFGKMTKAMSPVASPAFNAINSAIPRMMGSRVSPETAKGQFAASARRLRERLDNVGPDDYTRPSHYMGRPWPLSFFLAAVTNELAIHGWDIASRLGPEAHLSETARSVLPWFYWGATPFMLRAPQGLSGTIQLTTADPVTAMWWTLADGVSHQGTGEAGVVDVTITGETGTVVLVLAGRIKPDDALRTTSLKLTGNEEMGETFLSSWHIT